MMNSFKIVIRSIAVLIIPLIFGVSHVIGQNMISPKLNNQISVTPSFQNLLLTPTPLPFGPSSDIYSNEIVVTDKLNTLNSRVDTLQFLIESQSNTYSATISRWESNLNVILAIFALISIIVASIGFGALKNYMNTLVSSKIDELTQKEINAKAEKIYTELQTKWDKKFSELYDEYRGIGK